jgi:uncharacterized SAM-binding protein YcdF (DUF218 family)
MFWAKKIMEAFVLPPGIMVVALAGLAFYLRKKARTGAVVCLALAALVWVGTSKVFSDAIMAPLENAYPTPSKPKGDVIVLLCGGFRGGGNLYSASERLAPATLERAAAAYKLYQDTKLPILVSGGAPFSAEPEAEAAAAWLRELGVPQDKLLAEKSSRDTFENAEYTVKLCRERGFRRIILLTSAYHIPRAVMLFRKEGGVEITPFPVARRSGGPRFISDWLPGRDLDARLAINEYFGIVYYRLYYLFL